MGLGGAAEGEAMNARTDLTPRAVLAYGVLGIIPFWSLAAATMLAPAWEAISAAVVAAYAALILSFGRRAMGLGVAGRVTQPRGGGLGHDTNPRGPRGPGFRTRRDALAVARARRGADTELGLGLPRQGPAALVRAAQNRSHARRRRRAVRRDPAGSAVTSQMDGDVAIMIEASGGIGRELITALRLDQRYQHVAGLSRHRAPRPFR